LSGEFCFKSKTYIFDASRARSGGPAEKNEQARLWKTFEVKTATAYGKTLHQSKILQMRKRKEPAPFGNRLL